ncbi:hypothetical protein [Campylobacter sp. 19-13652]|uniref:hypothetical protein n=1 Tax=Campylobacter sp. 19-13652 TaxID=2840180 RepID=UPI001C7982B5|nr:hypothetical protein [Campylobacter sp. 19-13652]BCX79284.1 hypothetical protein LBC_07460 [Campylobacter sp. 19-13652]
MNKKIEQNQQDLGQISTELIMEFNKERAEFVKNVFEYELPQELSDVAYPLKFKEIKAFEGKFNLRNIDSEPEKIVDFIEKLLIGRGIKAEAFDEMNFAEMQILAHKVLLGTFDAKAIAAKK